MVSPYYKQHWIDIDDSRFAAYDIILQYNPRMAPLLDPLDLLPGLSVLDVGSGPGYTALELGRRVGAAGHVTGVDINETFVARANQRAQEQGLLQVSFQQAAFPPCPLPTALLTACSARTCSNTSTRLKRLSKKLPALPNLMARSC